MKRILIFLVCAAFAFAAAPSHAQFKVEKKDKAKQAQKKAPAGKSGKEGFHKSSKAEPKK
jgi:hypothetical protein